MFYFKGFVLGAILCLSSAALEVQEPKSLPEAFRGAQEGVAQKLADAKLIQAAKSGRDKAVEQLIQAGAHVDVEEHGVSALMWASGSGSTATVRVLLQYGARVNPGVSSHSSALLRAAEGGHAEVAGMLIDQGADPKAKNVWSETALHRAAKKSPDLDRLFTRTVQVLLEKGCSKGLELNAQDFQGYTALMAAAWSGRRETVADLLRAGADAGIVDKTTGERAFDLALRKGHVDIAELIVRSSR